MKRVHLGLTVNLAIGLLVPIQRVMGFMTVSPRPLAPSSTSIGVLPPMQAPAAVMATPYAGADAASHSKPAAPAKIEKEALDRVFEQPRRAQPVPVRTTFHNERRVSLPMQELERELGL